MRRTFGFALVALAALVAVAPHAFAGTAESTVTVTTRAWLDLDGDGVRADTEPPLAGVTCVLRDLDNTALDSGATDPNGLVTFAAAPADAIVVVACDAATATNLPDGVTAADLAVTGKGAGDDPSRDSDAAPDQTILVYTGDPGETDDGNDIGYAVAAGTPTPPGPTPPPPTPSPTDSPTVAPVPPSPPGPAGVAGHVFFDADGDGLDDSGDSPIGGVTAVVVDATGAIVGDATSGGDGGYRVGGLAPLTPYTICLDVAGASGLPAGVSPADLVPTPRGPGGSQIDATGCAGFSASGGDARVDAGYRVTR